MCKTSVSRRQPGSRERGLREPVPRAARAGGRAARQRGLLPSEHGGVRRTSLADARVRGSRGGCQHGRPSGVRQQLPRDGQSRRRCGVRSWAASCAGESSIVAMQSRPFVLRPGGVERHFVRGDLPARPSRSLERARPEPSAGPRACVRPPPPPAADTELMPPRADAFDDVRSLPVDDLTPEEVTSLFGTSAATSSRPRGSCSRSSRTVQSTSILRAKELRVDRPHGHILQAQIGFVPDERIMSTTAFACGVFNSHLTQGNTNFNTLLAVCTNPATPSRSEGQRILVAARRRESSCSGCRRRSRWGSHHCRWIYSAARASPSKVWTWTAPSAPRVNLHVQRRCAEDPCG